MDSAFRIPGTRFRFGVDSLVGLVPGVGDAATALISAYIVHRARGLGADRKTAARMLGNIAVDALVGSIPLAGDLFDAGWKCNTRNLDLLEKVLAAKSEQSPAAASGDQQLTSAANRYQQGVA